MSTMNTASGVVTAKFNIVIYIVSVGIRLHIVSYQPCGAPNWFETIKVNTRVVIVIRYSYYYYCCCCCCVH